MAKTLPRWWLWEPGQLNWWIATLFMIGSALFALGCVIYLAGTKHELVLDSVFFTGSIFFTSAAFCQFHQSRRANKIVYWSALSQFIGTLMFNMNTFDAFFDLGWVEQDLLVWVPDIAGCILFQISANLAMYDICNKKWCWHSQQIDWWIGAINFFGCVAFLISAILALNLPALSPEASILAMWSTVFTLIGACCFFVGAFLMWPEMIANRVKSQHAESLSS